MIPESGVYRRTIAAKVGVINYVVVNECRRVEHLHNGRQTYDIFTRSRTPARTTCEYQQSGTYTFAARRPKIITQIIDHLNIGLDLPLVLSLDEAHFISDQPKDLGSLGLGKQFFFC